MKGFKKFFVIYTCVLAVIVLSALAAFYSFISAYEDSLPEGFFKNYLSSPIPSALEKCISQTDGNLCPNDDTYRQLELMFQEAEAYKISDNKYSIVVDDQELGSVSIAEDEGRFGLSSWRVKDESYDISPWLSYEEITVPNNYTVSVNGFTLGSEYIVDTDCQYEVLSSAYEDYPWLDRLTKYSLGPILGEYELEICDADGNVVKKYEETDILSNCDEDTKDKIFSFCEEYIYRYMVFIGNVDGTQRENHDSLSAYIKPDGQLDELMSQALRIIYYANTTDWELLDVNINLCSYLGNNRYLADISYKTEITALGDPNISEDHARLIIFMEEDGNLLAEAMYNYNR